MQCTLENEKKKKKHIKMSAFVSPLYNKSS